VGTILLFANAATDEITSEDSNGVLRVIGVTSGGAINGTIASGQIAFGSGTNTITGSSTFTFSGGVLTTPALTTNTITLNGTPSSQINAVDNLGHMDRILFREAPGGFYILPYQGLLNIQDGDSNAFVGVQFISGAGPSVQLGISTSAVYSAHPLVLPLATGAAGQVLSTNGANPQQLSWTDSGSGPVMDVKNFGALGNGKYALNMNTVASSTNVTLNNSPDFGPWMSDSFSASDVGKVIIIYGAGTAGGTYVGTITAFTSASHVVIAPAAGTTTSYTEATWAGTATDGAAIQAAINACTDDIPVVYIPAGIYWTNQTLTTGSAPFCAKIYGETVARTFIICSNLTLNAEGLTVPDAPFGFELNDFTLIGPGAGASALTNANGIHFSTIVQIPKERLWYHDMRVSQYPQIDLIVECPIVSLFENFTCDNAGVAAINIAPASGFAGTSTVFNNGYANGGGGTGWLVNGAFYCTFNGCASDSSVTNWHIFEGSANTFNSCGSEGAKGDPWLIEGCPNMTFNALYIEIDPPVLSTQVLIHVIAGCSSLTFNNPVSEVNGNVAHAMLIDASCAYVTVIQPEFQNYNTFTACGPITDEGYANLVINQNDAQTGLALRTNDVTTLYNANFIGELNLGEEAHVGILTADQAGAILPSNVVLTGWGSAASFNYTEGSVTAFGIGINCSGTGITANPTITVYFPAFGSPPISPFAVPPTPLVSDYTDDDFSGRFWITEVDENHIVFTWVGTPTSGFSYGLFCHILGSF
jgi:hypothetical protein